MGAFSSILFSGAFLHGSFSGVFSLFSSLLFSLFWISEDGMSERAPLFAFLFCFFLSPSSKLEMRGGYPITSPFPFFFFLLSFLPIFFSDIGHIKWKSKMPTPVFGKRLEACLVKECTFGLPTMTCICFGQVDWFFPNMTRPFFGMLFPFGIPVRCFNDVWCCGYLDGLFFVNMNLLINRTYIVHAIFHTQ